MKKIEYSKLLKSAFSGPSKIAEYYSYFYNYSFGNQVLLVLQGVTSPVATFKKWCELGRSVKKGAKAKEIFIPTSWTKKVEDQATGEEKEIPMKGFILKSCLFQATDTDGKEFYSETRELPQLDKNKIYSALGITEITWNKPNGNLQGYSYPTKKAIAINPLAVYPEKTLLHEVAHCILHSQDSSSVHQHDAAIPQSLMEVEAEVVAYITGSYLGILSEDAKQSSRGYTQHWINGNNVPEKNAKRIFGAVDKILKALGA